MFRKILITLLITVCFALNIMSQESKTISGTWAGRLPCADCEYITYTLTLNGNNTFTDVMDYYNLDRRPLVSSGNWSYSSPFLTLTYESGAVQRFEMDGAILHMLDSEGKRVAKAHLEKQSGEKSDTQK